MARRPLLRQLPILVILLVSLALSATALDWGLPADKKSWAFDEVTPNKVEAAAERGFGDGWVANYPPLHYRLLHWTARVTEAISGPRWERLDHRQRTARRHRAGRWLSVAMTTLMIWGIYRCARLFAGRGEARLAALIAAACLPLTYYAKTSNVDAPYLFWLVASLFFLGQTLRHRRWRDHCLLALTAVAAVATKDQAYAAYVPVPFVLWWASYQRTGPELSRGRRLARATLDPHFLGTGLAAVAAFVVLMNLISNWSGFLGHLHRVRTLSVSRFDVYPATAAGHFEMAWQSVRHLGFALSWPLLLLAVVGVAIVVSPGRRRAIQATYLLCAVSYYVLFVSVIRHNYVRFLLPIALILAFFAATAIVVLWERSAVRPLGGLLIGLLLLFALARPLALDRLLLNDTRYAAEAWIAANISPGAQVRGIGRIQMLPRGLTNLPWQRLNRRGVPWLDRRGYDYLVLGRSGLWRAREEAVWTALAAPDSAFALERCWSRWRPWPLPSTDGIYTNLDKLSPEVCVFGRAGGL